ncbi:MAG: transposase, partial [Nitrospirae bacterium]
DLVHHCGSSLKGEFIYTLTATEVLTGWTELEPLRNKAMVWTKAALKGIFGRIPVPVRRLHTDNGSEFLNAHVQKLCKDMGIERSRSRPYRKNDAPYVESKNWSMVRAYTGWRRYDTDEEFKILERLLRLVSLRNNLFMPQMKVVQRQRVGGKIRKRYEMDIPLNRVLRLQEVDEKTKSALIKLRASIDIVELAEQIEYLVEELSAAYEKKLRRRKNHR